MMDYEDDGEEKVMIEDPNDWDFTEEQGDYSVACVV